MSTQLHPDFLSFSMFLVFSKFAYLNSAPGGQISNIMTKWLDTCIHRVPKG